MTRSTLVARTLIATVALTALGLAAAAPASAHTNNLFTVVGESLDDGAGYATMNKSDGQLAMLPESVYVDGYILGIEVYGEKGTAVYDDSEAEFVVASWNHYTGVPGVPVAMHMANPNQIIARIYGLDTLNDGTTVTVVEYFENIGNPEDPTYVTSVWVAAVAVGTGTVTPITEITDALSFEGDLTYQPVSLATDPATGVTYVFAYTQSPISYFIPVNTATGAVGDLTAFEGTGFGDGSFGGADFDPADGALYFVYYDDESTDITLSKIGSPSTWVDATRQQISTAPANDDAYAIYGNALTVEYTALAATGSEVPLAAIVLVGTVAVLAGGVTVMVARRRSERGTV